MSYQIALYPRGSDLFLPSVVFRNMLTLLFTDLLTLVVLAQFVVGHQLFACLKTVHFLPAVVENMLFFTQFSWPYWSTFNLRMSHKKGKPLPLPLHWGQLAEFFACHLSFNLRLLCSAETDGVKMIKMFFFKW